jgi:predicted acetyltransferase
MCVKLIEPCLEMKDEFLAMVEEHLKYDTKPEVWDFKEAVDDFEAYVEKLVDYAKGKNLPECWVPANNYWLVNKDSLVIGTSGLRHKLSPQLQRYGGHIGYYIRPTQRNRGYGKRVCVLMLEKAKLLGLKRVLITCDDDNQASVRIIENCGGVLEDKVVNEGHKVPTRRYWIEIK